MTSDKKTNRSKNIRYPFLGQRYTSKPVRWCGYERKESSASVITILSFAIIPIQKFFMFPCDSM
jgi:hypothetical protein